MERWSKNDFAAAEMSRVRENCHHAGRDASRQAGVFGWYGLETSRRSEFGKLGKTIDLIRENVGRSKKRSHVGVVGTAVLAPRPVGRRFGRCPMYDIASGLIVAAAKMRQLVYDHRRALSA